MKSDSSPNLRTAFAAVSNNGKTVFIAGENGVSYIDLAVPYQVNTLVAASDVNATSCAVSADGRRAITAHHPAQVRLWAMDARADTLEFAQPVVSVDVRNTQSSMCWMNKYGTSAVAIFTLQTGSVVFRLNWDAAANFVSICEKSNIRFSALAVSENQGLAVILESRPGDSVYRLQVQKLDDVGTANSMFTILVSDNEIPSRVCIAESAPLIFVSIGNQIRIYQRFQSRDSIFVLTKAINTVETLAGVSEDGTRMLTHDETAKFHVWHVPSDKAVLAHSRGTFSPFIKPMFAPKGDTVFYVDQFNNVLKAKIDAKFQFALAAHRIKTAFRPVTHTLLESFEEDSSQYSLEIGGLPEVGIQVLGLTRFDLPVGNMDSHPVEQEIGKDNMGEPEINCEDMRIIECSIESIRNLLKQSEAHLSTPSSSGLSAFQSHIHSARDIWRAQGLRVARELDKLERVLKRVKNARINENQATELCSIDLEPFKKGEKVLCLPCDHLFHYDCTYQYLSEMARPKCPLCRVQFSKVFGFLHLTWEWKGDGTDLDHVWSKKIMRRTSNVSM